MEMAEKALLKQATWGLEPRLSPPAGLSVNTCKADKEASHAGQ